MYSNHIHRTDTVSLGCRYFARWKLYVTLLHTKRERVRKAALKCFAMYTMRALIGWIDITQRAMKLRHALEARQVNQKSL